MKFRAVRPSQVGAVDAVIVPLFQDAPPPKWLPRATRSTIERIAKTERGTGRLFGVNTHHAEPRLVLVGAGKSADFDMERARRVASAGIRALWRANVRSVAIAVGRGSIAGAGATGGGGV